MNWVQATALRSDQPWGEIRKRESCKLVIQHHASSTSSDWQRIRCHCSVEYDGGFVHVEPADFTLTLDPPDGVSADSRRWAS